MTGRSILVVTSGPACRNPRPLKEAVSLAAAGYNVTLLTVFETERAASVDRALLTDTGVKLITLPTPSSFVAKGAQRLRVWVARRGIRYAGWQSPITLGPVRALLRTAAQITADLTIVHNEGPFWVGCQLLQQRRKVAADFEDWYSQDLLPEARRYRPLRLLGTLERNLLQRATYTTTTSTALATALADEYQGQAPEVLTNSFPRQTLPPTASVAAQPTLFWFSQTIGPGRGLEEFLAAWALVRQPSRVALLGDCDVGFREHLRGLIRSDQRDRLDFIATVSPFELPAIVARHDIGLALERREPRSRDLTITNKILQYLNAGLAVIASATTGQREVLRKWPAVGKTVILEEAAKTAAELERLLATPDQIREMKLAARVAAEAEYCWERQAPTLLRLVANAVTS